MGADIRSARSGTRASTAAALLLGVPLWAHLGAGGGMPSALAVTTVVALVCGAYALGVLSTRSWWRTATVVVLAQPVLHLTFELGRSPASAAHGHGGAPSTMSGGVSVGDRLEAVMAPMAVAHMVAALVVVVAVQRGEEAVARLGTAVAPIVTVLVARPLGPTGSHSLAPVPVPPYLASATSRAGSHPGARRGPPCGAAA